MSAEATIASFGTTGATQRQSLTADNTGHQRPSWANNLTSVYFWVQPDDGDEAERFGGESNRERFRIYTKYGQDIIATDRVVIGSTTYNILDVQSFSATGRANVQHMKLLCERTLPADDT